MNLINKNGIDIIYKKNKNTPRSAICLYFAIEKPEKYSGIYTLFARLLLQGTKSKDAQALAITLENEGIELSTKYKQDYFKIDSVFLNDDANLALDTIADIIENSTFDDFEKEVFRLRGEIEASLDNPRVRATNEFIRTIFDGHYYSNTTTKTLEELEKITKNDVKDVLAQIMQSKKVISVVGDFNDDMLDKIGAKFSFLTGNKGHDEILEIDKICENKIVKIAKNDANQAQIIKGWVVDSFDSKDYPKLVVMNNMLGGSGLSARLFYNLRDRQGLAYTVRSSFDTLKHGAIIDFYIATSPNNIEKCLKGFDIEIEKLQNNLADDEELQGAIENATGRLDYFTQTNLQIASIAGYDYIMGHGVNYDKKYRKMLQNVSAQDLTDMARKYLSQKSVTTILAPDEFLKKLSV